MKSFLISMGFFVLTVAVVVINAVAVEAELTEVEVGLSGLPTVETEAELADLLVDVREVLRNWEDSLGFLSLSIQSEPLRDLSISLRNLEAYCLSNSVADYNSALYDCTVRLEFLKKRESLAPSNIL